MTDKTNKPVIFLAFANDRDDTVGYLRNLPDEARRLRDVLNAAEQVGLCEVEVCSNSTATDIFKVFQNPKFRNRIAVFHYGGHANGYQLLLESAEGQTAAADAGGLAAFLAQQQGLQLVFLNGCSTQQQTQGLLDANVPAVISTSRSIDDRVATDFSFQFYQGLAGGATIRTAYNEAAAAARTAKGGDTRALYFGSAKDPQNALEADRWPWNLYLREGSERADQWNLPEAVNDPLFGLPPLPEQDLPQTPYRHLNWFTRKHGEVFFGRGHQIRELYNRLTAPRSAPIILFYGQSGVGKSSVLDAGLIPRLEQRYEVRYLRRTEGGLLDTLQLAFLPEASDEPLESAWRLKEEQTGKPLIVFLDQVEEHFTRPIANMPDELDQLLRVLQATFGDPNRRPQGKLVLGFRKEWLAELESHLARFELPRTNVFLERLDRRGIIEVVLGPARAERLRERYGLTVEDGLAGIIADNLLEDQGSAIAPTLQILLTKMWTKASEANYEHPHFGSELYQHLKREGILLRDFLNQQIAAFRERYPEAVDSGLLLDIVALHTTPLGTANECTVEQLQQQYAHLGDTLPDLLQQCQDLYLLTVATSAHKETVKSTRLVHDTLAPIVREQFDQSDKPGQRARRALDARSPDWHDGTVGAPLDDRDLRMVEEGALGTRVWSEDESRLVEVSREFREHRKRTSTIIRALLISAFVLTMVSGGVAAWKWSEATSLNQDLTDAKTAADTERDQAKRESARLAMDRGFTLCNQQEIRDGLLWIAKASALAPDAQLQSYVDQNLVDWLNRTCLVRHMSSFHGLVEDVVYSPDGRTLAVASGAYFHPNAGVITLGPDGEPLYASRDGGAEHPGEVLLLNAETGAIISQLDQDLHANVVTFSPDGQVLVTGSGWEFDRGAIRLWNAKTGEPLCAPISHPGKVFKVEFSPDSTRCLTVCKAPDNEPRQENTPNAVILAMPTHGELRVFDTYTGRQLGKTITTEELLYDSAFDSTDHSVMTLDRKSLSTWNYIAGEKELTVVSFDEPMTSGRISPGRSFVLTTQGDNKTCALFDLTNGKRVGSEMAHEERIDNIAFSWDDVFVATSDASGRVQLWWTSNGVRHRKSLDHPYRIWEIEFSPDNRMLGVGCGPLQLGSKKGSVHLWNTATGMPLLVPISWADTARRIAFHPTDSRIAVASRLNGIVTGLDIPEGHVLKTRCQTKTPLAKVSFSPNGLRMISIDDEGKFGLWKTETGEAVLSPLTVATYANWATLSPDGRIVAVAETAYSRGQPLVSLWNAETGERLGKGFTHDGTVTDMVFSGDATKLALSTLVGIDDQMREPDDHRVYVIHVPSGEPVIAPFLHEYPVEALVFSDDVTQLLTAGGIRFQSKGELRQWSLSSGKMMAPPMKTNSVIDDIALLFDSSRLVAGSEDGTVRYWHLPDFATVDPLFLHSAGVTSIIVSRDERKIATITSEGTGRVWDVREQRPLGPPLEMAGPISTAVLSPSGNRIVTISFSGLAQIWDASAQRIGPEFTHVAPIRGAAFVSEGVIVFSDAGGFVWSVEIPDLPNRDNGHLERRLESLTGKALDQEGEIRYLSEEEWRMDQRMPHGIAPSRRLTEDSYDHSAMHYRQTADFLMFSGETDAAEAAIHEAIELCTAGAKKRLNDSINQCDLADCYEQLGILYLQTNRESSGLESMKRVVELFKNVITDHPNDLKLRGRMYMFYGRLGRELNAFATPTGLQEVAQLFHVGVEYFPEQAYCHEYQAEALTRLGNISPENAEEAWSKSLEILQFLITHFPADARYLERRAMNLNDLAMLSEATSPFEKVEQIYQSALDDLDHASEDNILLRSVVHNNLGLWLRSHTKPEEAGDSLRIAIELRERMCNSSPSDPLFKRQLGGTLQNYANLLVDQKRFDEAEPLLTRAISLQFEVQKVIPADQISRQFLRNHYGAMVRIHLERKRHSQAAGAASDFAGVFPENLRDQSVALSYLSRCRDLLDDDASVTDDARSALVVAYRNRGVKILLGVADRQKNNPADVYSICKSLVTNPNDPFYDPVAGLKLAESLVSAAANKADYHEILGLAKYRTADWEGAVTSLQQSLSLQGSQNGLVCFLLAMSHHNLGNTPEASKWFQHGIEWTDNNEFSKVVNELKIEAEELITDK